MRELEIKLSILPTNNFTQYLKNKNQKAAGVDEISIEVWKTKKIEDNPSLIFTTQSIIKFSRKMDERLHPSHH